jgi:uncharacterized protein YcsI (UPF0317 family)
MAATTAPGELREASAGEARRAFRTGRYNGTTAGMAPGKLQGNLVVLPAGLAGDFRRYCLRNPKPCPLVGMSEPGDPALPALGADIDLRTDLPRYNVYRDGALAAQVDDLSALWRDDFVAFVLGCSFTFEQALVAAGISLRHLERATVVPMYRTNIETVPAGRFAGPMVVSMRPLDTADLERAIEITASFPHAHGAPVHSGDPRAIGIADLAAPDWGEATEVGDDQVPVFWACGVTPQAAIARARPPLCITHTPGSMLITDVDAATAIPVPTERTAGQAG